MRHHDDEFTGGDPREDPHDLLRGAGVEGTRGLVGEHDLRVVDQCPRDGDALHLPAGHLPGLFLHLIGESDARECLGGTGTPLRARNAGERQGEFHVGEHALVRNEVVRLEDETHAMVAVGVPVAVAVFLRRDAADDEVALGVVVKAADDVEQRRLAAPGGAEDRHELVRAEVQGYAAERVDGVRIGPVVFSDIV